MSNEKQWGGGVQMQSLKANMEEEAAEVHALMKANQISMQVAACRPFEGL